MNNIVPFQLYERKLSEFDDSQFYTHAYRKLLDSQTDLEDMMYNFATTIPGMDFNDRDGILSHPAFRPYVISKLKEFNDDLRQTIGQHIVDGKITLYRAMKVNDTWFSSLANGKLNRLGIYWSWDEKMAIPYDAYGMTMKTNDVVLVIEVDESCIDWYATFNLHHIFFGEYSEKEIRLFKNTPIHIKEIRRGKSDARYPVEARDIYQKTYKA